MAFGSILEKCLSEEMCLELKAASKYVLKNVWEAFLSIPKIFLNAFETIFLLQFSMLIQNLYSNFLYHV